MLDNQIRDTLNELILRIVKGKIFRENFFVEHSFSELIIQRYTTCFEAQRIRVSNEINALTHDTISAGEIDIISRFSYLMAYDLTKSDGIARLHSDDLELICKAYLAGYNDEWLNALICAYAAGQFPCGALAPTDKDITACMQDWLG